MTRYITPVTFEEYQTSHIIEDYAPKTDYYISDLGKLSMWKDVRYIPDTQVWCPLNSFNIPNSRVIATDREMYNHKVSHDTQADILCLQGAGDVLMATAWARELRDRDVVFHTYEKFANILYNNPDVGEVVTYEAGVPTDLVQKVISGNINTQPQLDFHYPAGIRTMVLDAIDSGWSHYDWMGLASGMPIKDRKAYLKIEEEDYGAARVILRELKGRKKLVGVHFAASSQERTCMELINLPAELPQEDIHYILFGGEESAGVKGYNLLNLAGKLSYRETAAVVSMLDCVVCADSVVLHLASLSTTPTLGVYKWCGPTWSGPENENLDTITGMRMMEVVRWVKRKMEGKPVTG